MNRKAPLVLLFLTAGLTGCGGFAGTAPQVPFTGASIQGSMHGGQQPVQGATLALYAANATGYGVANINLLTVLVQTDAGGGFTITGDYSCTAGQQLYLVGTGGNPGAGTNTNLALMAALGDCSTLTPNTFVNVNEVTTIASVFALAPFMSSYSSVGTSPNNTTGLVHAFASVNKLSNIATGSSTGSALPPGAVGPGSTVNTLADILAGCINSAGGMAGDKSSCGNLFSMTTPPGGVAPQDTIQAALNIAHNPALNVADLFNSALPGGPFQPQITRTPSDWTLAITYTDSNFSKPQSTTVDAAGNVWVANSGNSSVSVISQAGLPVQGSPFTGNGLAAPTSVAIDVAGNGWIANTGGANVSAFSVAGAPLGNSPYAGAGTISAPNSIAIDAPGNIWIANSMNNSVTELNGSGGYLQQITSGIDKPAALAINPK
jgi:hypothetical protein